jgi:hypothetical protein
MRFARPSVVGLALAVVAAGPLLAACADCFFQVEGKLVDCGTMAPLSAASITVHIDQGMHSPHTLATTFTTDGGGNFHADADATEDCGAVATLMFRKDGYSPLDMQFDGTPKHPVTVCMTPAPTP